MSRRFYWTVRIWVGKLNNTLQKSQHCKTQESHEQNQLILKMGGFCSGIKTRVKTHAPLDIKKSLNLTFLFFDQDPDFNCLSTVSFIKYIIHNVWSEETSSGACSLCLKANFPWMTGCPHFDSCALSEREENSSKYLRQFICKVDAHSQRLLLIVQGCFFQENAVSLRNTHHSTWLNNYKLMTFKGCN